MKNAATLVGLTLISQLALAEPTLYPEPNVIQTLGAVKNTTTSNILADEKDPRTVWVMPPNTATAQVSGLHTKTANLGFCAEMRDIQEYSRDLTAQKKQLTDLRVKQKAQVDSLQEKADAALLEAESFAASRDMSALSDLDRRIGEAEARLTELYAKADTCQESCDQINEEITSVNQAKNEMLKERNRLAKQFSADMREYEKRRKHAAAAQSAVKNAKSSYLELIKELDGVRNAFLESYQAYGKMEGARAAMIYRSDWDNNVATLRAQNPQINFSKLSTKNAVLMTELAGLAQVETSSAILSIGIGAELKAGVAKLPSYPEAFSTNVVLSLIGACPMEHPEYFDIKDNDPSKMKYGVIVSYEYDSAFRVKAKATYNMHKMYQKIVETGSSGGFFSTKSWTNVQESNFFKDSFSVKWEDQENTIPAEKKALMEAEMRKNVLARLAALALPTIPSRGDILQTVSPPPHGAVIVAEELLKVCGTNIYCQGGAAVATILDAIFGSSSTSASYTNISDVEVVEDYQRSMKITKPWLTSYVPEAS